MRIIDIHPGSYWVPDPSEAYPNAVRGIPCLSGETGYWTDPTGSGGDSDQARSWSGVYHI